MAYPKGEIKLKTDCLGCRAHRGDGCALKYKITHKTIFERFTKPVPLEICPKPRTYALYHRLMKLKKKKL